MGAGSLAVVGTGYGGYGRITFESASIIAVAEKVLFLADTLLVEDWIRKANPTSESLRPFYTGRSNRHQTYMHMTDHILSFVRRQLQVCVAFYGHPGVFVYPSHEAIIRARDEGFEARMLPGISAEDCLFSDLGIDPGRRGCQSFEATDFLIRKRQADVTIPLILWQVGSLGVVDVSRPENSSFLVLSEALGALYGPDHDVVVYEAAPCPPIEPIIEFVSLAHLAGAGLTPMTTLYVPPKQDRPIDHEMARRLGLLDTYLASSEPSASRYNVLRPYASPKPRSQTII